MRLSQKTVEGYKLGELKAGPIPELAEVSRLVAAEGAVLLKNDNGTLPLKKGETVSLFGRIQTDYYKSGTGSGGMVNVEYVTNIIDSLRTKDGIKINEELASVYADWIKENPFDMGEGWAKEPWSQVEMPLPLDTIKTAAEKSDKAVVIIGRTAGEDRDNYNGEGSYRLTGVEEELLKNVCSVFDHVCVVLNVGNIVDMSWQDKYKIDSILCVWQGGMEGGNAAADLLCGDVNPSGRLSDTIAYEISDYPSDKNFGSEGKVVYAEDIYVGYRYFETFAKDRVRYPFGFGLSYTTFDIKPTDAVCKDGVIKLTFDVANTGEVSGKQVVQVYYEAPQGVLGRPARELAAFYKTGVIEPGKTETALIEFPVDRMAAFDDGGKTGNKYSFVLESGDYNIYAGADVRSAEKVFCYTQNELKVTEKLSEAAAPVEAFERMYPKHNGDKLEVSYEAVPLRTQDPKVRLINNLPTEIPYTGDKGIKLVDVYEGRNTLDEFVAQLSVDNLHHIVLGEGMNSPKVTPGTGGSLGGVTDELIGFGIPIACVTDGPSGIRMDSGAEATALPNGTLIACTFNTELTEKMYVYEGIELAAYKIDALLGPGMNIHRHPLNGRNFEYFSEDPYLTGVVAAAICRGMEKAGTSGTIKHFCCNNQEYKRHTLNSVVSQRALREIYLKPFEIAVKQSGVCALMTSYNPINGLWAAGNYDLDTVILRDEWGYDGFVMTDWWASMNDEGGEGTGDNKKAMVRAQNDVYMVNADAKTTVDNIKDSIENGELKISELQRCAKNLLKYLMKTHAFERLAYMGEEQGKSFVDKIDSLSVFATLEITEPWKTYIAVSPFSGNCAVRFSYISDESELSQIPIRLSAGHHDYSVLFSVHGTEGKRVELVHNMLIEKGDNKLSLQYSKEMVRDIKIELLG